MISASALTVSVTPWRRYVTPVARVPSSSILVTNASVRTVRFGRSIAGRMKASATDQRRPLRHVTW